MSKWYYYLVKNTNGECLNDNLTGNFVVCRESPSRQFSSFKDHIDFFIKENYKENYKTFSNHYYEIITDYSKGVKCFFDIDVNLKTFDKLIFDQYLIDFKSFLIDILNKETVNTNFEVLLYDSSNNHKISYHVVINKIFFNNIEILKSFIDYVKNNFNHPLSEYIDYKVYKTNQQFRMLYSSKNNSKDRTKRVFKEECKKVDFELFEKSLITFINDCNVISFKSSFDKYIIIETKKKKVKECEYNFEDIEMDYQNFLTKFLEENPFDIKTIKIQMSEDNDEKTYLVIFTRLEPSECIICERTHDNDNPYMFINTSTNTAVFNCRRNENNLNKKFTIEKNYIESPVKSIDQKNEKNINSFLEKKSSTSKTHIKNSIKITTIF